MLLVTAVADGGQHMVFPCPISCLGVVSIGFMHALMVLLFCLVDQHNCAVRSACTAEVQAGAVIGRLRD